MFGVIFNLVTRIGQPKVLEHWKMIVFILIVKYQTIVPVTETSCKMASTLCQKWLTIFVKKPNILYGSDHTVLFKLHQHMAQIPIKVSFSNGTIEYPIGKSIFAGCTPLINRVRRHLASQCSEIDNLAALPCLFKWQQKQNVENGVDTLLFYVRCALLLAFSTSWHRKSNIS